MSKKEATLENILLLKLQALYDIETQIVKALPNMVKAASDPELKEAFSSHLEETEAQASRLEQAFELLGQKPKKLKAEAIRGLIEDAKWIIKQKMPDPATDIMLVGAASYVEHYEMAGYMSAVRWARETGQEELADLLETTLEEEKMADEKLKMLAEEKLDSRL